ncbi:hypothetical protein P153DRAFT_217710 [Dothidotthia symphoricarpi CBS 119687]|uniref:Uncharacterized protein n=1 Tax=Dothidotthia symphoricarpi CBS 119687 TaxID=1392245 RepID=A0A6A6AH84_9PLEO|nr:uncharacterized protein P153DRAFT_217710 [Dothidotthia symphoricarpi CBS 119687]KAF2130428.1 hypothetical protein P153DRAFT_217710 [Dothidotthia symphoricarpi CBS 119687]
MSHHKDVTSRAPGLAHCVTISPATTRTQSPSTSPSHLPHLTPALPPPSQKYQQPRSHLSSPVQPSHLTTPSHQSPIHLFSSPISFAPTVSQKPILAGATRAICACVPPSHSSRWLQVPVSRT